MVLIRYHYTGDWSELSLVLGRPLEGLGRGAGQLYNEDRNGDDNEDGIDSENPGGLGEEGEQSKLLIDAWSNFVKHHNPNGLQGDTWPEYKAPLWQHR